jgi:uncharacterized protein YkwD
MAAAAVRLLARTVQGSSARGRNADRGSVVTVRTCLALLAVAALAVPAGARASGGCRDADALPGRVSQARLRAAMLCLMNGERSAHGLKRLRANHALSRAAAAYARQMVRRHFFDHRSPSGSTMMSRIRSSDYVHGATSFTVGENLAWGAGPLATPRAIVRAWMRSREHRANLLDPEFRDVGIGVAAGAPARLGAGTAAGTYVADFGRKVRG